MDNFGTITLSFGATLYDPGQSGSVVSVTSGTTSVDAVISAAAVEIVFSGGTMEMPTVLSGGTLLIQSGGIEERGCPPSARRSSAAPEHR